MRAATDWKAIAKARGIETPDLEVIIRRQQGVESAFRPAAQRLTPDQEPAAVFRADPEAE